MKKTKQQLEPEPYWQLLVTTFFDFCRQNFGQSPSFDGSSPRDMKSIIKILKKRCEDHGVEWSEDEAIKRWRAFLEYANTDEFLHGTFVLSNLNKFKDKIFFRTIKPRHLGTINKTNNGQRLEATRKSEGGFGSL